MKVSYESVAIYRTEVTGEFGAVDEWFTTLGDCPLVVNGLGAPYDRDDLAETVLPNLSHEAIRKHDIEIQPIHPIDECSVAVRRVASEHLAGGWLAGVRPTDSGSGTRILIIECGPAAELASVDDSAVRTALATKLSESRGGEPA